MGVAIFSQSHIIPAAAYIHQVKTVSAKKDKISENQCALQGYNYPKSVMPCSPIYPIEANAQALKEAVRCGRTLSQTKSFDFCMQDVIQR